MGGVLVVVEHRREDVGLDWSHLHGKSTFNPDEFEAAVARGTIAGWQNPRCEYRITIYRRDQESVGVWETADSFDEIRVKLTALLSKECKVTSVTVREKD